MAIEEQNIGPFWWATFKVNRRNVPLHVIGIAEMVAPWRVGKAVVTMLSPYTAIAFGLWVRPFWRRIDPAFAEEQWINPKPVSLGQIDWSRLTDVENEWLDEFIKNEAVNRQAQESGEEQLPATP